MMQGTLAVQNPKMETTRFVILQRPFFFFLKIQPKKLRVFETSLHFFLFEQNVGLSCSKDDIEAYSV